MILDSNQLGLLSRQIANQSRSLFAVSILKLGGECWSRTNYKLCAEYILIRMLATMAYIPHYLVLPRGIEPRSSVLQTVAMTTSAKAALGCLTSIDLVLRVSQTPVQATTLKTPLLNSSLLPIVV